MQKYGRIPGGTFAKLLLYLESLASLIVKPECCRNDSYSENRSQVHESAESTSQVRH